jgi:hypothetical protein
MDPHDINDLLPSNRDIKVSVSRREDDIARERLVKVLRNDSLPEEYYLLLQHLDRLELLGKSGVMHFYPYEDVQLINDDPAYSSALPFLFYFGDDNGETLYAFDPKNEWGYGTNAIFMVSMGAQAKEYSSFLARNLKEAFRKLNEDEDLADYPLMGSGA